MQNPSGKLLGLVALFAAIGIITATGAFTTVEAERTATIDVAGDANALLALDPAEGDNGDYATHNDNGLLEVDMGNALGDGVNKDAKTHVRDVFTITNNGQQDVEITITDAGDNPDMVTFYSSENHTFNAGSGPSENLEEDPVTISPGSTITVSIWVDTDDYTGDDGLVDTITVEADAPN